MLLETSFSLFFFYFIKSTFDEFKRHLNWVWWHTTIIPPFGNLRQEDLKFLYRQTLSQKEVGVGVGELGILLSGRTYSLQAQGPGFNPKYRQKKKKK
jgi:hypothetical protein